MRTIAIGGRDDFAASLVSAMHEFRRTIFVHRLGWSLPMNNGTERDDYDHSEAVYVMSFDGDDRIVASARLLPTTRPYMLSDLFPELLAGAAAPCDPTIWELSRFAVDLKAARDAAGPIASAPAMELLRCVMHYARTRAIERLSVVTCLAMERLLMRGRLELLRLGPPSRVRGTQYVALLISVPPAPLGGIHSSLH
jgi:acyl homoserine lactone synthase